MMRARRYRERGERMLPDCPNAQLAVTVTVTTAIGRLSRESEWGAFGAAVDGDGLEQ
jgi:hypothetical protein